MRKLHRRLSRSAQVLSSESSGLETEICKESDKKSRSPRRQTATYYQRQRSYSSDFHICRTNLLISQSQSPKKHALKTDVVLPQTTDYKCKLTKYKSYMDRAFTLIKIGNHDAIIEGETIINKVMNKAWANPRIGKELGYSLCDYMREGGHLERLVQHFIHSDLDHTARVSAGRALEESLSTTNRGFLVDRSYVDSLVRNAIQFSEESINTAQHEEATRLSISLLEQMFKYTADVSLRLIELGALDHIVKTIGSLSPSLVHRHAAVALANLSVYSDTESHRYVIAKNIHDWLFLLASMQDVVTRYYACFAICMLVSNKEIESLVSKSGTLSLVEPFLNSYKPQLFVQLDTRHSQGRPGAWLEALVSMLASNRREARSLAAYHMVIEAGIKKQQETTTIFHVGFCHVFL